MPWIDVDEHPDFHLSKEEEKALVKELTKAPPKTKPKKMRFYADADFPPIATEMLREFGFNVLTAQEAGKRTHPDENHIAEAQKQGRILLTRDRDFLYDQRYPLHTSPTLVVCNFGSGTPDEIVATFHCLIVLEVRAENTKDQVPTIGVKIDANPSGWTEKTSYQEGDVDRYRYRLYRDDWQVWID